MDNRNSPWEPITEADNKELQSKNNAVEAEPAVEEPIIEPQQTATDQPPLMKRNVYDFDRTIYNGDSTVDFYKWVLRHYPKIRKYIPSQLAEGISFLLGSVDKETWKGRFYTFLRDLPEPEKRAEEFWEQKGEKKIKQFYLDRTQPTDVIISASPEFLLRPIAKKFNCELIASGVDTENGKLITPNCYGKEKVNRLNQAKEEYLGEFQIAQFYSDDHSDDPLAALAEEAIYVSGTALINWEIHASTNWKEYAREHSKGRFSI